jgi:hypothetical protein
MLTRNLPPNRQRAKTNSVEGGNQLRLKFDDGDSAGGED